MPLESRDLGLIVAGGALVALLAYVAHDQSNARQARFESGIGTMAAFNVLNTAIDQLDTGDHYFHPAYCVPGQTQIFTAHKYPSVSGGSVSTLIHQGMDALARPAPQDDDWRVRPPGEVMW